MGVLECELGLRDRPTLGKADSVLYGAKSSAARARVDWSVTVGIRARFKGVYGLR